MIADGDIEDGRVRERIPPSLLLVQTPPLEEEVDSELVLKTEEF